MLNMNLKNRYSLRLFAQEYVSLLVSFTVLAIAALMIIMLKFAVFGNQIFSNPALVRSVWRTIFDFGIEYFAPWLLFLLVAKFIDKLFWPYVGRSKKAAGKE